MPRLPRSSLGGICYHVINRGNARRDVFLKSEDYEAFLKALRHAGIEVPMRVLAYCLMPNHFHFVVWPQADGDLSRWMHWVLNTHVRRYHQHYHSSGHIWQGRFKAFPIQQDDHLLAVLRYVERNPVRAGLVRKAQQWRWSSAGQKRSDEEVAMVVPGPIERPADWRSWVNQAVTPAELTALRRSVNRGTPYGSEEWMIRTASALGLQGTLRPRGRPRKGPTEGAPRKESQE